MIDGSLMIRMTHTHCGRQRRATPRHAVRDAPRHATREDPRMGESSLDSVRSDRSEADQNRSANRSAKKNRPVCGDLALVFDVVFFTGVVTGVVVGLEIDVVVSSVWPGVS